MARGSATGGASSASPTTRAAAAVAERCGDQHNENSEIPHKMGELLAGEFRDVANKVKVHARREEIPVISILSPGENEKPQELPSLGGLRS